MPEWVWIPIGLISWFMLGVVAIRLACLYETKINPEFSGRISSKGDANVVLFLGPISFMILGSAWVLYLLKAMGGYRDK